MPKEIAIYLNLLYSRTDTGCFYGRTSATLLTDSTGDVITSQGRPDGGSVGAIAPPLRFSRHLKIGSYFT
jgi:hypothetical protein